jgi:hypothetical protein
MTLRLAGSTSGYTEIDCPSVGGNNTLVLPTGNGSSGQVLTTNGSGALSWIGAGKILQVVNATYSTAVTSNSSTYADTGLTATITPTLASSKILVLVNQVGVSKYTNNTYIGLRLLRSSSVILTFENIAGYTNSTATNAVGSCSCCYLDSPSTTSATIYKTQFSSINNNATVAVQDFGSTAASSTITLLEVAA